MMARFSTAAVVLLLLAGLPTLAWALEPRDLVGKYTCKGENPDGSKYEHPLEITVENGNTLKVIYQSNRPDIGLGSLEGKTLKVRFQGVKKTDRKGTAEYELQANGVLKGWWHDKGEKKMPERLIPKKK
jgi:hypothetical protein